VTLVDLDGGRYDACLGFLLLSLTERVAFLQAVRRVALSAKKQHLLTNTRSDLVASAAAVRGFTPIAALQDIERFASAGWLGVLDAGRRNVRLVYEGMLSGPRTRDVPGFRAPELAIIDRESALGTSSIQTACHLFAALNASRARHMTLSDEQFVRGRPALHLVQDDLPPGVALSRTVSAARPFEPVLVLGAYAYPVSRAWTTVPFDDVERFASAVAQWMQENWSEALALCCEPRSTTSRSRFDRCSRVLIAEAYARGHLIEEAALFLVDQRSQDEIYPQALESEHEMYLRALAERFRGTGEMLPV
jgi:hypothetical protein